MTALLLMSLASRVGFAVLGGPCMSENSVDYGLTREIDFNRPAWGTSGAIQVDWFFESGFGAGVQFGSMFDSFEWAAESEYIRRTGSVKEGNLSAIGRYSMEMGSFRPYMGCGVGTHWGSYTYTYTHADSTTHSNSDGLSGTLGLSLIAGLDVAIHDGLFGRMEASYHHVPRSSFPGWLVQEVDHIDRVDFHVGLGFRP